MEDATTAFLAFGVTFAALAGYAVRLAVRAHRLGARLAATRGRGTAKGKNGPSDGGPA